jgi:hypothetical protein
VTKPCHVITFGLNGSWHFLEAFMTLDLEKKIAELSGRASMEQNPKILLDLVTQLNDLLDEKEQIAKTKRGVGPGSTKS